MCAPALQGTNPLSLPLHTVDTIVSSVLRMGNRGQGGCAFRLKSVPPTFCRSSRALVRCHLSNETFPEDRIYDKQASSISLLLSCYPAGNTNGDVSILLINYLPQIEWNAQESSFFNVYFMTASSGPKSKNINECNPRPNTTEKLQPYPHPMSTG